MATKEIPTEQSELLKGIAALIQAQDERFAELVKAMKAPTEKEQKELDKIAEKLRRAKEFWQRQTAENAARQAREESRCGHIRPEDGFSLFQWYPIQGKANAWKGHCSRCFKTIQNFQLEPEFKLLSNPEYEYWRKIPTGMFQ